MNLEDMDIVYVIKPDEHNEELRYSLRTLKNIPHRKVWIYGYKPSWVTNVEYVAVEQTGTKWENTAKILELISVNLGISDNFILFNDDFFILKPITTLPLYYDRKLVTRAEECKVGRLGVRHLSKYGRQLIDAASALTQHGYKNPLNYELHTPFIYNKDKLAVVLPKYKDIGYAARRSIYGNTYAIGGHQHDDCKIYGMHQQPPNGATFVSTTDMSFEYGSVGHYIKMLFKWSSKYERR